MNFQVLSRSTVVLGCAWLVLGGVSKAQPGPAGPPGTVLAWGSFDYFGLTPPVGLTNAISVAVGGNHCLALRSDGTVIGWGNSGDMGGAYPPVGLSDVRVIAAGYGHSLALKTNGAIVGWGTNGNGQLNFPLGLTNVSAIAAGDFHSLALTADGRAWVWGANGLNPAIKIIPPGPTNFIAIAGGGSHSLAVRSNGTVVAWGDNSNGQCDVPPGLTGVVAVAAGSTYSLARKSDGTVVAWGAGYSNGPPGLTNIVALATGSRALHILTLRNDGMVLGWGDNTYSPLNVPGQYTNWAAIACGLGVSFGITLEPVLLTQPVGASGLAGTNFNLSVSAVGSVPWSYQWLQNGTNPVGGNSSTLQLINAQVSDSGNYSVLLSNQYGSILSSSAMVVVQPFPPSFTIQPTNQAQLAGGNVSISVSAIGAPPISYQWYFRNGLLAGATNATLSLTNVSDFNAGVYYVVITNAYGSVTSAQVSLVVNDPPTVTNGLVSLNLPAGTNYILNAFATGTPPLFYQWQFQGTNIPGATNLSLVLSNLQSNSAGPYGVVVSNAFGMVTNTLYNLAVVDSPPVIYQQPASQLFLVGANITLRVSAYGTAPITCLWYSNNIPIPTATNMSLALTNLQGAGAASYFAALSNAFGTTNSAAAVLSLGDPYPGQVDWPVLAFTPIVTNTFMAPTGITHAGDGTGRLFVLERKGRALIVQSNTLLPQPFLNITNRVLSTGAEQGLLGMAFSPSFASNGQFYVDYNRTNDGAVVISRFSLTADPNIADSNSEQIILVIPKPFVNHNGGQLAFGPDGYLYIGVGDGGSEQDPQNLGQKTTTLLGKLLRIDVEGGVSPYAVPASNPFAGNPNYFPEIWALGLRNPWRFSFDRLTGDMYIGDVGQNSREEIDFQPAGSAGGQNYGWRIREGNNNFIVPPGFTNFASLTAPVFTYSHVTGISVIGGYVYRGPNEPRMNGTYFYGDFGTRRVWGLRRVGTNWQNLQLGIIPSFISTFGEDDPGTQYVADYNVNEGNIGTIYQLTDTHSVINPGLNPAGGFFVNNQNVILSTLTPGAIIRYTIDGRDPTEFDPGVASGTPIQTGGTLTLKVRAFRNDLIPSSVVAANFSFQVAGLGFSPATATVTNGTVLTMSSGTTGAALYYTLDGSDPGQDSTPYTGPFVINGNTTLRAIGLKSGYASSDIATAFYALTIVPSPVIAPAGGVITNGTLATITCSLPDAEIHYTTNGGTPTLSSPLYAGPFPINGNSILMAGAWVDNYAPSGITTATYQLLSYVSTVVQTLAGQPQSAGFADGPALQARFNSPQGVCADSVGNVFVADTGNNRIRKVLTNGMVVTVAGSGQAGTADGVGTNATFSGPTGVALDAAGNLFVADAGHELLRKVTPAGTVSTFANLARSPFQTGELWQLVVDTNGAIYVGGFWQVFKVETNAAFTNFAGAGFCCPPDWNDHIGVALDGLGGLFATIRASQSHPYGRVVRLSPGGGYELYAGDLSAYTDGPRLTARFIDPLDVAKYPDGGLVVSDWTRVRMIDTNGNVMTLAGTGQPGFQNGPGSSAAFGQLGGLRADAAGTVYVADFANNCIRKISRDSFAIGIADAWQLANFGMTGIDPNGDPDHDGLSNLGEFLAGTDPNDANSCLQFTSVQVQPVGVRLNWSGGTNAIVYLQRYSGVNGPNAWQDIQTNQPGTNSYLVSPATNAASLYRLMVGYQ